MAPPAHSRVDLLAHKAELHTLGREHMKSAGEKDEHVVECCTIQNGCFLEYFAQGSPDQTLRAGLEDDLMLEYIDIAEKRLVIPCRSKEPPVPARVTITSLRGIGRFVAASLDLRQGEMTGQIGIAGATCSFDSVVTTVSAFPGFADMALEYTTAEESRGVAAEKNQALQEKMARSGEFDVDLLKGVMVAQIYACMCEEEGGGGVVSGRLLNKSCPEVETTRIEEFLRKAWCRYN